MKIQNLAQIWVCSPKEVNDYGQITNIYINLRSMWANVQRDYNETDIAEYGQTINEVVKVRTQTFPEIREFDHLYLTEPEIKETMEIDGESYGNYGQGDYSVESVIPSKIGVVAVKNPTTITARIVTKG